MEVSDSSSVRESGRVAGKSFFTRASKYRDITTSLSVKVLLELQVSVEVWMRYLNRSTR